jgi:hypothetical protein
MTKRHLTIAAIAAAFAIPASLGLSHVAAAAPNAQRVAVAQSRGEALENGAEAKEPQNGAESNESAESAEAPESNEPKGPDTDSVQQGPGNVDHGADSETAD